MPFSSFCLNLVRSQYFLVTTNGTARPFPHHPPKGSYEHTTRNEGKPKEECLPWDIPTRMYLTQPHSKFILQLPKPCQQNRPRKQIILPIFPFHHNGQIILHQPPTKRLGSSFTPFLVKAPISNSSSVARFLSNLVSRSRSPSPSLGFTIVRENNDGYLSLKYPLISSSNSTAASHALGSVFIHLSPLAAIRAAF